MKDALFIARQDIKLMLKGWEALLWLFVMPIVFFYFIGTVTSGMGGGARNEKRVLALWSPGEAGFLSDRFAAYLEREGWTVVKPESREEFERAPVRLEAPENFTSRVLSAQASKLFLGRTDTGLQAERDQFQVWRSALTIVADLAAVAATNSPPSPQALEALDDTPRTLTLQTASAGKRRQIPTGFQQAIPGILVMFTLLVLLTSGAATLVIERNQGLLRRLASTPISRGRILAGKWAGRMALAGVQVGFALLAGTLLFGMNWGPDFPMVLVVLAGWASVCASLGLLLGNVAGSPGQAVGAGVLTSNLLAALGGCWWPIEITPGWAQALAKFLPTGWAMDALHKLISFESGPASVTPHVVGMFAAALAIGWLAARRFRFQ